MIIKFILDELGLERGRENDTFSALAIDSLEFISLIKAVESEYGIKIRDSDIADIETPQDLAYFVSNRAMEQSPT